MNEFNQPAGSALLLGRYEVRERLGHGGMSVVHRGFDRTLKRDVAIKIMLPALASDAKARRRFQREAEAIAGLQHRGILDVYDFAVPERSDPFMVMELVDGMTLRRFVEQNGSIPPGAACRMVASMARALQVAHDAGIVHRDLKPDNIMVSRDGRILLMDFGIAHVMGVTKLTLTGALVGSPAHMAPEIIEGEEPGTAADIFALGSVLYFVVSGGKLPFDGRTPHEVMKRIVEGRYTDVRSVAPVAGQKLAAVVDRCLQTDPARRFGSAEEVAAVLDAQVREEEVPDSEPIVRAYLAEPERTRADLLSKLRARLERALPVERASRNRAALLDVINRLLALDPEHAEAQQALHLVARGDSRRRWIRLGLTLALLAGAALGTYHLVHRDGREALETGGAHAAIIPGPPGPPAAADAGPTPGDATGSALAAMDPRPEPESPVRAPRRSVAVMLEKAEVRVARRVPPPRRHPAGIPGGRIRRSRYRAEPPDAGARPGAERDPGKADSITVARPPEPVPVDIFADPPAAAIYVDGTFRGFGRTRDLRLRPGVHKVVLRHSQCAVCAETAYALRVEQGQATSGPIRTRYRIRYLPAVIRVRTANPGRVFLDGAYVGRTNTDIEVAVTSRHARKARLRVTAGGEVHGPTVVTLQPGQRAQVDLRQR